MKRVRQRIFGVVVALLSSVWVLAPFAALGMGSSSRQDYVFDIITVLIALSFAVAPGVVTVYYGVMLARKAENRYLPGAIGFLLFQLAMLLSLAIESLLERWLPKEVTTTSLFLAVVLLTPIHAILARVLANPDDARIPSVSRGWILLVSVLLWTAGSAWSRYYAPHRTATPPNILTDIAASFGPIIVAWIVYRFLASKIVDRPEIESKYA